VIVTRREIEEKKKRWRVQQQNELKANGGINSPVQREGKVAIVQTLISQCETANECRGKNAKSEGEGLESIRTIEDVWVAGKGGIWGGSLNFMGRRSGIPLQPPKRIPTEALSGAKKSKWINGGERRF